jgi:uncharacterized membrane protein YcgQ (UPF0703/DUF1980 family)
VNSGNVDDVGGIDDTTMEYYAEEAYQKSQQPTASTTSLSDESIHRVVSSPQTSLNSTVLITACVSFIVGVVSALAAVHFMQKYKISDTNAAEKQILYLNEPSASTQKYAYNSIDWMKE